MAKSAFVAEDEQFKYVYPYPLDDREATSHLIDQEVLFEDPDDEKTKLSHEELPWVRLRIPRSRRLVNQVAEVTQSIVEMGGGQIRTTQPIVEANRQVFELLVAQWSLTEDVPNGDDYDRLDRWAGAWITNCLANAMARGEDPESFAKKEEPSSKKRSGSRSSSPAASGSG